MVEPQHGAPSPPTPRFALGTFSVAGAPDFPGLTFGDRVYALEGLQRLAALDGPTLRGVASTLALFDHWEHDLPILRVLATRLAKDESLCPSIGLDELLVRPPVQPRQILCAGANYHKHVVELVVDQAMMRDPTANRAAVKAEIEGVMRRRTETGKPFVFAGLASAVIGAHDLVLLPHDVAEPDWELELAVVMGRSARRVHAADALDYVAGYTIANDITARERVARPDVPQMGMDWMAAKCSPSFLPIGPFITPAVFVDDPQRLQITLRLNGEAMQNESTADMIFDVAKLIAFISAYIQLLPGDVILTGSPSGNGTHYGRFLRDGDVMEGAVSGLIGVQRTPCRLEAKS